MKIPSKLRIMGFDWEILKQKDVATEGNIHGSTHSVSQKIFLAPDDTQQKAEQTFLHEVMHAVWWQMCLHKRDDLKKFEEEIVSSLSSGLYQVFKDNNLLK